MLGAVGNWSPPSPSASSPKLPIEVRPPGLGLQLVSPFCRSFSPALMLRITLWAHSSNSSLVLRPGPPCLLKNFHDCSFFSWRPHVHELLALLRSVLACGPDVEVQGFVNHALRLHVSRGGSWSRSTEPSCESEGAVVWRDTAPRLRRSTGRGPTFTCGGTSTSGSCVSHLHVKRLIVLSELSTNARWLVAHYRDLLSEGAGSSAVSAATRLTSWATFFPCPSPPLRGLDHRLQHLAPRWRG